MYKKYYYKWCGGVGAGMLLLSSPAAYADISGNVFTDFNLNGQLDSTSKLRNLADTIDISVAVDKGVSGAEVRAECVTASGNASFGPVTTDASGQFTLPTPAASAGANNCILQLSKLPEGYSVGTQASSAGSNVLTQFVSPSAAVNFAVQESASYCQNNPDLATSRYANGQQTPRAPFAGNNDVSNLFAFPYNSGATGTQGTKPTGFNTPNEAAQQQLALAQEVGSVFGLGWHPASNSLFAAAYMKPWTGFGTGGTGAIYRTNMTDPANPVTSVYADLNQIFPATPATAGDDPYLTGEFSAADPGYVQISDGTALKTDGSAYPDGAYVVSGNTTRDTQGGQIAAATGSVAFGDLDVSADGKSLFAVNLADRSLYVLPVQATALTAADAAKIQRYAVPFDSACRADGAGAFNKQAFGLGEYQGDIYVATRCDSAFTVPLFSIVRFDRQAQAFDATPSLRYVFSGDVYGVHVETPADMVFDSTGNITLAFREIDSEKKQGAAIYGTVRHACVQDAATHQWVMESNGACGGVTTAGQGSGQGPNGGDFFFQEWPADQSSAYHQASYGGAVHIPGFLESAYTVADPFNLYGSGVAWLDVGLGDAATAGQRKRAYEFYRGNGGFDYPDNRPINGKSAAIGDLEVLCDQPSIEIGNRVWQDSNADGIQDAGEPPLASVTVELFAQGADVNTATPLATALTDADGYYVFSSDTRGYPASGNTAPNDTSGANGGFDVADIQGGRASTASHKYGISALLPTTTYQVVIRQADGATKQTALSAFTLTTPVQGTDAERNSDGGLVGTAAISNVTTLDAGNHYHAVDFGFKSSPVITFDPPPGPDAFSCAANVRLATSVQVNGDSQAAGSTGAGVNGLITFDYAATGELAAPFSKATAGQVGAVWGLAYDTSRKALYAAAFLKRHASFGPNGLGAIYQMDGTSATPTPSLLMDLAAKGVDVGTSPRVAASGVMDDPNELPIDASKPSWDRDAFAQVGKISLGDIDISADGNTLWAVNLKQRELVEIDLTTTTVKAKHAITDPGCSNGEFRPWAVKVHEGKVWVGTVCSAETSQRAADLQAYVQAFDGTTFTTATSFALDYVKGNTGNGPGGEKWQPWTDTFKTLASGEFAIYPQPILSDIEFDMDGSLILGFMDRMGHQVGGVNYTPNYPDQNTMTQGQTSGDIIRVCNNGGKYVLENNATCTSGSTAGKDNGQGFGNGEYYWGDMWDFNQWNADGGFHQETSFGGLAFKAGSGEIALTAMNPLNPNANAGGVIWLDNATGGRAANAGVQVYRQQDGTSPYFGKAAGMGDVELFCAEAALQPDVSLSKVADKTNAKHGETVVYTLTVRNDGKGEATGVRVSDKLPETVSYVSDDSNGAYDSVSGVWTVGALSPAVSKVLMITVKVK